MLHENGGALFLLVYFFLLFLVGTPVLISELMIGKIQGKGVLCATSSNAIAHSKLSQNLTPFRKVLYKLTSSYGVLSFIISFFILGYVSVISGWILYFLFFSVMQVTRPDFLQNQSWLINLNDQNLIQLILAGVHLFLMSFLIRRSFQVHVKKWLGYASPLLSVFMLILIYKIFTESPMEKGFRFMFYPNFHTFSWSSFAAALGQLSLSLSIGFGAAVSFGSQFKKGDYVPAMGYRVSVLDGLFSVIAMLLIIPMTMILSTEASGPEMIFQVVPQFFEKMEYGALFSILFFSFLYLGAMGGTITMLQSQVQNLNERFIISKKRSLQLIMIAGLLISIIPAYTSEFILSKSELPLFSLLNLDALLVNWLLPLAILLGSQQIRLYYDKKTVEEQFLEMNYPSTFLLFDHWQFVLKWVVPILVVFSLLMNF